MKNLLSILDTQLADEKTSLAATSCDIERAANYCQDNFLKGSTDGKLNSTMAYATQSLGTVSFHISRLAAHFLDALELENNILAEMNDRLEKVKMFVNIHEEKVARKAIGSCTTQKVPIVFQHEGGRSEAPPKFIRRAIDYSILDDIGHGIRSLDPTFNQYGMPLMHATSTIVRRASASNSGSLHGMFGRQHSTISSRTVGPKTSIEYAAPAVQAGGSLRYASGTVGRTAGIYRTAVVPPQHFFGGPMPSGPLPTSGGTSPASLPSNYASSSSSGIPGAMPAGCEAAPMHHSGRSSGSSSVTGASAAQQTLHHQQQGGSLRTPVHYAVNENFAQQQQQVTAGQFMLPQHQPVMMMMGSSGAPISVKMPITTGEMNINGTAAHTSMLHHHQHQHQHQQQQLQMQQHLQLQRQQSLQQHHQFAQQQQYAQQQQQQQQQYQRQQPIGYPVTTSTSAIQPAYAVQMPAGGGVPEGAVAATGQQPPPIHLPVRFGGNETNSLQSAGGPCQLVPRRPEDPAWVPDFYMEKVITLYEYTRDKDDELTFTENQIIYVIKKNDDGWWEGMMNGVTGLFPGNYVELSDA